MNNLNKNKLNEEALELTLHYFRFDEDIQNFIEINKKCTKIIEEIKINPIPITEENEIFFSKIEKQQIFSEKDKKLTERKEYIYKYTINYDEFLEIKDNEFKCKRIKFTDENRKSFGNLIPKYVNIIGENCFKYFPNKPLEFHDEIIEIENNAFEKAKLIKIELPD